MHDSAQSPHKLFEHARPTIVTDEGASADTYTPEVVLEQGLSNVANMQIRMSNELQDQFVSKYMPRIFRGRSITIAGERISSGFIRKLGEHVT